jgi:hypothetical protein
MAPHEKKAVFDADLIEVTTIANRNIKQNMEEDAVAGAERGDEKGKDRKTDDDHDSGIDEESDAGEGKARVGKDQREVSFDVRGSVQSSYLKKLEDRLRFLEEKLDISGDEAVKSEKTKIKKPDEGEGEDEDDEVE